MTIIYIRREPVKKIIKILSSDPPLLPPSAVLGFKKRNNKTFSPKLCISEHLNAFYATAKTSYFEADGEGIYLLISPIFKIFFTPFRILNPLYKYPDKIWSSIN